MSGNELIECSDLFRNTSRVSIIDANVGINVIRRSINNNQVVMVPQTYCYDYALAVLGRAVHAVTKPLKEIYKTLGLREYSLSQIEKQLDSQLERIKNVVRELRCYSSNNSIIVCNISRTYADRIIDELKSLVERGIISKNELKDLVEHHDHYYIALYKLCRDKGVEPNMYTEDKCLDKTIDHFRQN